MKVRDIAGIMDNLAPENLKESYDNVGVMVGSFEMEVTDILIALDCTMEVIKEAVVRKCNFIITHHPLLFNKPQTITDNTLIGKKIIELIRNNLSLYSSHTNLDIVEYGLNDIFTELLGYEEWSVIEKREACNSSGKDGIGRLIVLKEPSTLLNICNSVKDSLGLSGLKYTGEDSKLIRRIAIVNGSGEDFYALARNCTADLIITGDTKYHNTSDYYEMGLSVIDAGHFETEWPAMKIFANRLKKILNEQGYDNSIVISEACKPLYKYFV